MFAVASHQGIERLVVIPLPDLLPGVRPPLHRQAIAAAVSAGVRHIIYVSSVGARLSPRDGILETHFATEQALIELAPSWTILRMGPYTDFLLAAASSALESGTYAAVDGAPVAPVVRENLAAAAAGLLTTTGHDGVTYHATGPASVSQASIAETLSRIAGRPLRYSPLTIEQYEAGLESAGLPAPIIDVLSRFQAAGRDGLFDVVTGDVARLSGSPAESVHNFLVRSLPPSLAGRGA